MVSLHPYQSGTKMNVAKRVAEWHLSSSTSPQGIWAPIQLFRTTQEVSHIGLKIESSRIWNKVGASEHNPLTVCDTSHSSPACPWDIHAISWSPPKNPRSSPLFYMKTGSLLFPSPGVVPLLKWETSPYPILNSAWLCLSHKAGVGCVLRLWTESWSTPFSFGLLSQSCFMSLWREHSKNLLKQPSAMIHCQWTKFCPLGGVCTHVFLSHSYKYTPTGDEPQSSRPLS